MIHHHNELFDGESIPSTILLDAIHGTVDPADNTNSDRFFDIDTLRELCGCLISVNQERRKLYDPHDQIYLSLTVFAVSIAHYTVLEYLEPERISQCSTAYFAISTKAVCLELTERTLLQAQKLRLKENWKMSHGFSTVSTHRALMSDFAVYCVASSMISVCLWQNEICASKKLFNLTKELFHPLKPHFNDITLVATAINKYTDIFGFMNHGLRFFEVKSWPSQIASDTHIFLCFLLLIPPLGKKMLEEGDVKDLLTSRLTLKVAVGMFWYMMIPKDGPETYDFEGSVLELFAQFPTESTQFRLFLDYALGHFDPSRILILHIGSHDHRSCTKACAVEKLLHAGADANAKGYRVMALQIAVACRDYDGIKTLLEAGADPNNTGDANGVQWSATSIFGRFNFLHKLSPLHVCRNLESIYKDSRFKYDRKGDGAPMLENLESTFEHGRFAYGQNSHAPLLLGNIESLLIQYGADEILEE